MKTLLGNSRFALVQSACSNSPLRQSALASSNGRTIVANKMYRAILCAVLILGAAAPALSNDDLDATKTITWTFGNKPPEASKYGYFDWTLTAQAGTDNQSDGPHALPTPWKMLDGQADFPKSKSAAQNGADAKADIDFSAEKPKKVGDVWQVTATIHVKDHAQAANGTDAAASSRGWMQLTGGTVSGVEIKSKGLSININPTTFKEGKVPFKGTGTGSLSDPISASFFDLNNDTRITQNLFSTDFEAKNSGTWSWGANGIALNAPTDGSSSVSLSLQFLGSWITDPKLVNSSVSLANGVFDATGMFKGLPWIVTPTSADLPGGFFDSIDIPYQVPANLINDGDLYVPSLYFDESGQVSESAPGGTTPEPSSLFLLGSGILGLACVLRKRMIT